MGGNGILLNRHIRIVLFLFDLYIHHYHVGMALAGSSRVFFGIPGEYSMLLVLVQVRLFVCVLSARTRLVDNAYFFVRSSMTNLFD